MFHKNWQILFIFLALFLLFSPIYAKFDQDVNCEEFNKSYKYCINTIEQTFSSQYYGLPCFDDIYYYKIENGEVHIVDMINCLNLDDNIDLKNTIPKTYKAGINYHWNLMIQSLDKQKSEENISKLNLIHRMQNFLKYYNMIANPEYYRNIEYNLYDDLVFYQTFINKLADEEKIIKNEEREKRLEEINDTNIGNCERYYKLIQEISTNTEYEKDDALKCGEICTQQIINQGQYSNSDINHGLECYEIGESYIYKNDFQKRIDIDSNCVILLKEISFEKNEIETKEYYDKIGENKFNLSMLEILPYPKCFFSDFENINQKDCETKFQKALSNFSISKEIDQNKINKAKTYMQESVTNFISAENENSAKISYSIWVLMIKKENEPNLLILILLAIKKISLMIIGAFEHILNYFIQLWYVCIIAILVYIIKFKHDYTEFKNEKKMNIKQTNKQKNISPFQELDKLIDTLINNNSLKLQITIWSGTIIGFSLLSSNENIILLSNNLNAINSNITNIFLIESIKWASGIYNLFIIISISSILTIIANFIKKIETDYEIKTKLPYLLPYLLSIKLFSILSFMCFWIILIYILDNIVLYLSLYFLSIIFSVYIIEFIFKKIKILCYTLIYKFNPLKNNGVIKNGINKKKNSKEKDNCKKENNKKNNNKKKDN